MPDEIDTRDIVLIIHGMGTHQQDNTKKDIINGLNNAAKNFGFTNFNFENDVKLVEINYKKLNRHPR